MKASKVIFIVGVLFIAILSGCNRNAADMVTDGHVIINEHLKTITFISVLTDEALEPNTPFQARFFLEGSTIRNALGIDLVYTDEELKSHKKNEKSKKYSVEKTIEIKESEKIDQLIKEIKDKDKKTVTVEIVNENGKIDEMVLHKIEKE
ncbi:hypothetical protein [Rossellomorea aquimaris]|uniref:hypothetical protein n=1 Tax=Rossellomorea aquimaris TaxID=189382 RepID=UPI0007D04F8F|nr:hypothetical protein [Rossellomorea aquimaris]